MDMSANASLVTAAAGRSLAEPLQNPSIERILRAVREHLGTEVAVVSRFTQNNERELTHVDAGIEIAMGPGFRDPRENSYCWYVAEKRLPELIQDPADHALTQEIAITGSLPVGCHLSTPLRLSDGTLYGSLCSFSRTPDRTLHERDLAVFRGFAALAAEQVEKVIENDFRRQRIDERITKLIEEKALEIVHQPIHSVQSGKPVGVECLSRFPDAMMRSPDKWFTEAAEIGRGVELEVLAVEVALASLEKIPPEFYISVNASPETIVSGRLEPMLAKMGNRDIVVEVTGHHRASDFNALRAALKRISPYARIAIDDVGLDYECLRHLIDLSPKLLKLDLELTRDIHQDVARCALVGAIVRFAEAIGCKVVAEGIEYAEEASVLKRLGVEFGQGFLYAKPMPVADAVKHLKKG